MSTLHMDTEQVRLVATDLERKADVIREAIQDLASQVRHLNWISQSSDSFRTDFAALQKQTETNCDQAVTLSLRVQREVNEWLEVDESGTSRLMPNPAAWDVITRSIRDLGLYLFFPYTLQEGFDHLMDLPAGMQLIDELIAAKIRIQIVGDGSYGYQGADAKIITLNWGESVGGGEYDPGTDSISIPNDLLSRIGQNSDHLAKVIGHELQHALDDQTNTYTGNFSSEDLKNYSNQSPEVQNALCEELANELEQNNIDSEIRAYERMNAISTNESYQDDGINTGAERQAILDTQLNAQNTYESYYEKALGEKFPGLEFDITIDPSGEVNVRIIDTGLANSGN